MADEVNFSNSQRWGIPLPFTVADGTTIERGTILKITDPRTAAANDTNGGILAGIAAYEKVASDGRTELGVWVEGIRCEMTCSGNVALGDTLTAYNNRVQTAALSASGLKVIGYAHEAGSDGEIINVLVRVGGNGGVA